MVFCVVTTCCLTGGYHRFGGTARYLCTCVEKWHCMAYRGSCFLPLLKQEPGKADLTSLVLMTIRN
jgi:hypothetical protein